MAIDLTNPDDFDRISKAIGTSTGRRWRRKTQDILSGFGLDIGTFKPPVVATTQNPLVDRSWTVSQRFAAPNFSDPESLQDYIDHVDTAVAFGEDVGQEAINISKKAARTLANRTDDNTISSFEDRIAAAQAKVDRDAAALRATGQQSIEARREALNQQFQQSQWELLEAWERQKQTVQSSMSFSWFGRSTFAADKQLEIQKNTDKGIQSLAAARDANLAMFRAEQEGADAETIAEMQGTVDAFRLEAAELHNASIAETDRLNREANIRAADRVNNLLEASSKWFGEITDDEFDMVNNFSGIVIDDEGNLNESVISRVPEHLRAIVIATAAKAKSPDSDAAETVTVGSGKNQRRFQRDPNAINSSGGKGAYSIEIGARGGAWGGWGWGGKKMTAEEIEASGIDPFSIDFSKAKFKNQGQWLAFGFAARILNSMNILDWLEEDITGFSTAGIIGRRMSPNFLKGDVVRQQKQTERDFVNAVLRRESGAAISGSEFRTARKQYLPQPWDDAQTLKQKRVNRMIVLQGMAAESNNFVLFEPGITVLEANKTKDKTDDFSIPENAVDFDDTIDYQEGDFAINNGVMYIMGSDGEFYLPE